MSKSIWIAAIAAAVAGCAGGQGRDDSTMSRETERTVEVAELHVRESRTLSALAKLEEALSSYINREGRIPDALDQLVPKYLAEIPSLEIDVRGHGDTSLVKVYPASILRDGQIDGTQLKDSGRWGYVHNDRQVVVFIDCTHRSRLGHPWYQQHGVF